jgi:hypothetical protein
LAIVVVIITSMVASNATQSITTPNAPPSHTTLRRA